MNMKSLVLFLSVLMSTTLFAQKGEKWETLVIKSSTQCDMCKKTIEDGLSFSKGVRKVDVDYTAKLVSLEYNPKKTTPEEIRVALLNLGYDADEQRAPADKVEKLHGCCQPGNDDHHKKP
jgi:mercuric ion binding protein